MINPNTKTTYVTKQSKLTRFAPFPLQLLDYPLSMTARVQYSLLLDRTMLSQRNRWLDEEGRVYIYYPEEELCKAMRLRHSAVRQAMRELENNGLITRRRQKGERARRIYTRVPVEDSAAPFSCSRRISGSKEPDFRPYIAGFPMVSKQKNQWKEYQQEANTERYQFSEGDSL